MEQHEVYILSDPNTGSAIESACSRYEVTSFRLPRIPLFLAMIRQAEHAHGSAAIIDARLVQDHELWTLIHHTVPTGLTILVIGVTNAALRHQLLAAGATVLDHTDPEAVADAMATAIGVAVRATTRTVMIAIGGAKGGIGKSTVASRLAEVFTMRGLRVLLVDADINASIAAEFKLPPTIVPYLRVVEDMHNAGFTPHVLQSCLYRLRQPWGAIDFLIATDRLRPSAIDMTHQGSHGWQGFMIALRRMHEVGEHYDVILIDTGPDIKRRPYLFWVTSEGGWALLPAPPRRHDREGLRTVVELMQEVPLVGGNGQQNLSHRAMITLVEPEAGSYTTLDMFQPILEKRWPHIPIVGSIPRAPQLLSYLEEQEEYLSPLAMYPAHPFSRAFHTMAEHIAALVGLELPVAAPRTTWLERFRARFQRVPHPAPAPLDLQSAPPSATSVPRPERGGMA